MQRVRICVAIVVVVGRSECPTRAGSADLDLSPALVDDPFQFCWQIGIQANRRHGITLQNRIDDHSGALATERQGACRHLVKHSTKRKQIRANVQLFHSNLLGDL